MWDAAEIRALLDSLDRIARQQQIANELSVASLPEIGDRQYWMDRISA